MITKTTYLAYVQCPKAFWLQHHRPQLAVPPDPAVQRRLQAGHQVDLLARQLFPEGFPIPYRPQPQAMVPLTEGAIADGNQTLFQATIAADDLLIKADILTLTEAGWSLIEVKSSNSVKEEHLPDVAFQLHVLGAAGLPVSQAGVMHLNRECRYPHLDHLFNLADVTSEAGALLPQVAADIHQIRSLLAQPDPPDVKIGRHCTESCPFYAHCWRDVDGLTIYHIPRLSQTREAQLEADDILYLRDIPADFPLTTHQRRLVDFIVQAQVNIDREAIRAELAELTFPLYFFDFETIDHAVPCYPDCTPYQQVPFQYSCHVLSRDGELTHYEYLHTDSDDPRRPLIHTLLEHIGETGTVIVYYAPFERTRLRELAAAFPEHRARLQNMIGRLWDQLDIFKRHYRDYRFGKSNSLKSVLPVVVPDLSYQSLAVQDGAQAQVAWLKMITADPAEKQRLASQLRDYCRLDTLAMVKIHQALTAL